MGGRQQYTMHGTTPTANVMVDKTLPTGLEHAAYCEASLPSPSGQVGEG